MSRLSSYRRLLRNMRRIENSNKLLLNQIEKTQKSMSMAINLDQSSFLDEKIKEIQDDGQRISDLLRHSIIPDIQSDIEYEESRDD